MNPSAAAPSYQQYTPRSILDRAYWHRVASTPATRAILTELEAIAGTLPQTPAHPLASDFLAAKWANNRDLLDRYWQGTRAMLSHLVMQRCLDGRIDAGVDEPLLNWLWSFLTSPTWVVSAHIKGNELPHTAEPQLDLAACEMAAVLAETLQTLKPWIDNQSVSFAPSIVHEIDRRVLTPFVELGAHWWFDPEQIHNNWTGVCAGSILAACESLAAIGQPRPAARDKAIRMLNLFLEKAFTPGGECDEGVGYWNYGVGFACIGWSRLAESELHEKVDMPRLRQIADYPRQVHLFGNTFFSGNDAMYHAVAPFFATRWLAGATQSSWLAEWDRAATAGLWNVRNPCVVGRAIDSRLQIEPGPARFAPPEPARFIPDQQVGIFTVGRLTAYLSGGHNGESHNHNDLGQFGVFCDEKVVIADLGAPYYTSDFFGPKRYTYLSASSRGHTVPLINGQEQIIGRNAAGKVIQIDLANRLLTLDLTAAYPKEAKLSKWVRTMIARDNHVTIADAYVTSEAIEIESVVWSVVEPIRTGSSIRLGELILSVEPSSEVSVEAVDPKPHKLREFTQTLYRIAFTVRTQANTPLKTNITLSV